jgi:imidazolonepropionase-like amidohydrolase
MEFNLLRLMMRFLSKSFLLSVFVLLVVGAGLAQTGDVLIKNATVMTAFNGTKTNTDVLIRGGKIARIGKNIKAGGANVIDATGKYLIPGIIDAHSHAMLDSINEGTYAVTSMTRTRDVLNPTDVTIYRALAGGVTTANLLHGSANPIGGQNTVVKLKYGRAVEDFVCPGAPAGIKFAMGENVKRSRGNPPRYPATRMGTLEVMRDALVRARDYKKSWEDYRAGKSKTPPRKDEELDPIVEILEGKRLVHAHGYRSDEHLNLMRLADEFGFKIATLQHGLEAYKIAAEIKKYSAGVSIFVDFWGYKMEAYDTIPYNAYILWKNGVLVSLNSDSGERIRRLNLDAAKTMKYGGVPEEEALKMITINPAIQLGVGDVTGSIEVGKAADLGIWSGHPFSVYSRAEKTFIDGEIFFDRDKDIADRAAKKAEREKLEAMEPNLPPNKRGKKSKKKPAATKPSADKGGIE